VINDTTDADNAVSGSQLINATVPIDVALAGTSNHANVSLPMNDSRIGQFSSSTPVDFSQVVYRSVDQTPL
jgi:hypothetical protein